MDVRVVGLGPGGCAAALASRLEGLSTLAVEACGPQATRLQLALVRPGAQAALQWLGLRDVTQGRRTTTIRHVENRLRDETSGTERTVSARHVIDAAGGRLESLGRPARVRAGTSHWVITAEYGAPPWFDRIVGARDATTHELYLLFPTWGRRGVIAYFDSRPGSDDDGVALAQRVRAIAEALALGPPKWPASSVDVFQRALQRPNGDRVLPIGDAVGTVDVLPGACMSTAIVDGVDAARSIAAAQRLGSAQATGRAPGAAG